jgi:hypothetical protein
MHFSSTHELLAALIVGLLLSLSAGVRITVPLLAVNLLAFRHVIALPENLAWMGSEPTLIILSAACAVETLVHFIPAAGTTIKALATPLAFVAGTLLMAVPLGDKNPLVHGAGESNFGRDVWRGLESARIARLGFLHRDQRGGGDDGMGGRAGHPGGARAGDGGAGAGIGAALVGVAGIAGVRGVTGSPPHGWPKATEGLLHVSTNDGLKSLATSCARPGTK